MDTENEKTPKAIVVGGSIAGLSSAHALITAGWKVIVIEKSTSPPAGSPTGAGLSLEPQAREVINRWLGDPSILHDITFPLTAEVMCSLDRPSFDYIQALPSGIILWGHRFVSLHISNDKKSVTIKVEVLGAKEVKELVAHLLVAADGSLSMIRQHFLPDHKLRYAGYSAWRGVFDFSEDERSDAIIGIKRAYPELGNCLYLDYAKGNHCVLFELRNKRLNWIWYFDSPEPDREGTSVTKKVNPAIIQSMHEEAAKTWTPELAVLMKQTKQPFINLIYDNDPLPQLFFHNVVLVGDAAHPTTPHASRSTNMSILDAEVLGRCLNLENLHGMDNLNSGLREFEAIRLPVVSEQVMRSRKMGRLKQGMSVGDEKVFDPSTAATAEECEGIQHKNIPFYDHVPVHISS